MSDKMRRYTPGQVERAGLQAWCAHTDVSKLEARVAELEEEKTPMPMSEAPSGHSSWIRLWEIKRSRWIDGKRSVHGDFWFTGFGNLSDNDCLCWIPCPSDPKYKPYKQDLDPSGQ